MCTTVFVGKGDQQHMSQLHNAVNARHACMWYVLYRALGGGGMAETK